MPRAKRPRGERRPLRLIGVLPLLALLLAGPAEADYETAIAAFDKGDYEAAYDLLLPLAEGGDRNAQFTIGFMYDYGRGLPASKPDAVMWYRLAAEQGLTVAQFTLGAIFEAGRAAPLDLIEAFRWYSVAARNLAEGETRDTVIKRRDAIAARLSIADRAEAEARIAGLASEPASPSATTAAAAPEPATAVQPAEPAAPPAAEPPPPPESEPEPDPIPDPTPDPATTRVLDERLRTLGEIVRSVDSVVSADPGWVRLNNWEVETMEILESRLGRAAAEGLRAQAGDTILGDPLGNFQNTTGGYRRYLEALKAQTR